MSGAYHEFLSWKGMDGPQRILRRLAGEGAGVHAVLIYGRSGSGKTALARAISQLWMCPKPNEEGPCGDCGVCRTLEADRSVDLQWVHPWGLQGLIKRSSVNEMKSDPDPYKGVPCRIFFRTRPLMARHKVMIFEEADKMNPESANALLKTLEEPEPHAKLILTTSEFGKVLPTLRSRSLAIACPTLAPAQTHPFADSMGEIEMIQRHREAYDLFLTALEAHFDQAPASALALATAARKASEMIADGSGLNARQAHVEIIRCASTWVRKMRPEKIEFLSAASRTHRAILQNASAPIGFDHLFALSFADVGTEEPLF